MFTGIVQDIGVIRSITDRGQDRSFEIETNLSFDDKDLGASVCCSGCCLTLTKIENGSFHVDVSGETLRCTVLGTWEQGTKINIEPSLKIGDELGGHFVFGHVDTVTRILDISPEGKSHRLEIEIPENLSTMIASKGSIALDGVSLTVNETRKESFFVNIIPHTWEQTTLGIKSADDKINLEIDMLARYVKSILGAAS